jgi:hypothetical protein
MLLACISWLIFLGLYLLLAGQVSLTEIVAGVPAAAFAACFTVLLHRVSERRFRLDVPWWRVVGQPLAAVMPDAICVGRALLGAVLRRPLGPLGALARQPFRQGGDVPPDPTRRGLVTLGSSLAPNGFVVSIPQGQDILLLHRLVPAPPDPDREWPL